MKPLNTAGRTDCDRLTEVFLCLAAAAAVLLFVSSASPLFATNFWTDTNIYFTIGRGMRHGLMPYRDLFDHKGPLLFGLYAAAAWISETNFLGVFLIEVLSMAGFLYVGSRIAGLYGGGCGRLLSIPLTALLTGLCTAFTQGGSAEEFCLPALAVGIWVTLRQMRREDDETDTGAMIAFGAAAAWVFLIKYTDCGLFFGLGACLLGHRLLRGGLRGAVTMIGRMLIGFVIPTALTAGLLAAGGCLGDCIRVYFVQNLFEYSGTPMSLKGHVFNALAYLRTQSMANPYVALAAAAGFVFAAYQALRTRRKGFLFELPAVPAGAGLLLLFCYWGEMAHPYYALVFAALCPCAFIPLGRLKTGKRAGMTAVCAVLCAAAGLAAWQVTERDARGALRRVDRESMPQTVFAGRILSENPDATLLDLCSLDQGFYLAAGRIPNVRYFADNNLDTAEKREAISGYLSEAKTDYVVCVWKTPGERYELIDEMTGVFDLNDRRPYKLYRRKDEDHGQTDP